MDEELIKEIDLLNSTIRQRSLPSLGKEMDDLNEKWVQKMYLQYMKEIEEA